MKKIYILTIALFCSGIGTSLKINAQCINQLVGIYSSTTGPDTLTIDTVTGSIYTDNIVLHISRLGWGEGLYNFNCSQNAFQYAGPYARCVGGYVGSGTFTPDFDTIYISYSFEYIFGYLPEGPYYDTLRRAGATESSKEVISSSGGLKLYPNPNNGQFTIESSSINNQATVEIFNMLGEKVYTSNLNEASTELNLSNNTNGVYLYRVLNETGSLVLGGKFIVRK